MFLNKEEERMLQGEDGTIIQKSMKILVTLGDVFGAERMVKVKSVHVSGISYKNIGDPALEFLEDWADNGATTRVYTTINPSGMDMERWREFGISDAFGVQQRPGDAWEIGRMGLVTGDHLSGKCQNVGFFAR